MEQDRPADPAPAAPRLPRAPGLDGIRALAVLAVMAYHGGFAWIPGGFYGVDAFFVLSGFLITSLLVVEWRGSGTVVLRRFWARRARRLLPALFLLVATLGLVALAFPHALPWPDPTGDALATLLYVANWHFVSAGAGYFAGSGVPSPLLHTWSLAIEEQFYLVWPLVVLAVLAGGARLPRGRHGAMDRRGRLRLLGLLCVAGAAASASWMWRLAADGANINRLYYGTDTRAQALLVGGALAVVLALHPSPRPAVRRLAAVAALAGLLGMAAVWHLVPETSTLAFRGGFLLASLAAAAVVAGVVLAPRSPAARGLALWPLRALGRISYGAYLWYWPVILVVTPARVHLATGSWGLFACRTAITVAIAAVSYRFLEQPVRTGQRLPGRRALVVAPVAASLALSLVVVATTLQGPAVPPSSAAAPVQPLTDSVPAHGGRPPVRVLLVGDSMAGSLGAALAPYAARYDVTLVNEGHPGCAVSSDSEFRFLLYHATPGPPCRDGDPSALLDAWQHYVDQYRPQVVLYLARTDQFDQVYDGSWTSIGSPGFDGFLSSQLRRGLAVLGSRGARVVLTTSPYYNASVDGAAGPPEDTPSRVVTYDRILRAAARAVAGTTVYPLGGLVDPGGTYQPTVDGVTMRCADAVHFSRTSGRVIAPKLLPALVDLGRTVTVAAPRHPPAVPPLVPGWYDQLQCGPG